MTLVPQLAQDPLSSCQPAMRSKMPTARLCPVGSWYEPHFPCLYTIYCNDTFSLASVSFAAAA